MLLAGLKGHAKGWLAVDVNGPTNNTARHKALVGVFAGKECSVRTTIAHGNSQALARPKHHVGTPGSGGRKQGQGQNIGSYGQANFVASAGSTELHVVAHRTAGCGVLHQCSKKFLARLKRHGVAKDELHAYRLGTGLQQGLGLHVDVLIDKELQHVALLLLSAASSQQKGHGLCRSSRLVQKRGIRNFHARQVNNQGLEVQNGLQATLGDFGLVGRVGRVPSRIF